MPTSESDAFHADVLVSAQYTSVLRRCLGGAEQQRVRLLLLRRGCGERNYVVDHGPELHLFALQTLTSERRLQASAGNRLDFHLR